MGPGSPRAGTAGGARPQGGRSGTDRSANHFAFACHALRRGMDPAGVARKVAERALVDGKRDTEAAAMAYALGVVAAAQARLWI